MEKNIIIVFLIGPTKQNQADNKIRSSLLVLIIKQLVKDIIVNKL